MRERVDAPNVFSPSVPSASLVFHSARLKKCIFVYIYLITHFNTADIDDIYQITMFCLLKHSLRSSTWHCAKSIRKIWSKATQWIKNNEMKEKSEWKDNKERKKKIITFYFNLSRSSLVLLDYFHIIYGSWSPSNILTQNSSYI